MTRNAFRFNVIRAHAGRRDDEIIDTVIVTTKAEDRALQDRIFEMNSNLTAEERATRTYYGIAPAAGEAERHFVAQQRKAVR